MTIYVTYHKNIPMGQTSKMMFSGTCFATLFEWQNLEFRTWYPKNKALCTLGKYSPNFLPISRNHQAIILYPNISAGKNECSRKKYKSFTLDINNSLFVPGKDLWRFILFICFHVTTTNYSVHYLKIFVIDVCMYIFVVTTLQKVKK